MKFKNKLEEEAFGIAQSVFGDVVTLDHNKDIRIEKALYHAVTTFAGPPKKEIDVLAAQIAENPPIDLLVSCKDFTGRADPAHVQEWGSVVSTMSKYSAGTRYLGLVLCPKGFSKGCEGWATTHNVGLVPPLKGRTINYTQTTALKMFERILKALNKRLHFPSDELFTPPGFYDFCYDLTSDFEGFEEAVSHTGNGRYYLRESGWKSSLGEVIKTFIGERVVGVVSNHESVGLVCKSDITFTSTGDTILIGPKLVTDDVSNPRPIADLVSGESRTMEYLENLIVGKTISSVCDFGSDFEFGINSDINLRFHPQHGFLITEFGPDVPSMTAGEVFADFKPSPGRKKV